MFLDAGGKLTKREKEKDLDAYPVPFFPYWRFKLPQKGYLPTPENASSAFLFVAIFFYIIR